MEILDKIRLKIAELEEAQGQYTYTEEDSLIAQKTVEINELVHLKGAKKVLFDKYKNEIEEWRNILAHITVLDSPQVDPETGEENPGHK